MSPRILVVLFVQFVLDLGQAQLEGDFEAIEEAVDRLNRPDFMEIPHLLQEVSLDGGYSTYKWAEDVEGIPDSRRHRPALTRNSLDHHVKTIIFPSGQFEFALRINRSYVVLRRHSVEKEIFFFNLVYLRDEAATTVVEWTTYDPENSDKTKAEKELCRAESCDFPEWILGTCPFVSHVCNGTLSSSSYGVRPLKASTEVPVLSTTVKPIRLKTERSRRRREATNTSTTASPNATRHIPDSFDLLEMEREDDGSYLFKNNVRRREVESGRNAASNATVGIDENMRQNLSRIISALILHSVGCIDCTTIGPFFQDLEEDPEFSMRVASDFRAQFGSLANSTQVSGEGKIQRFNLPYLGFGNCKHSEPIIMLKRPKSEEIDDIIQYYLATLRVDCRHHLVSEVRGWLTTKLRFLHVQSDLSLKVLSTSPLLTYVSLTAEEYEMMFSALLFYKYTVVYLQEKTLGHVGTDKFNPTHLNHSRRILFLTRLFLEVIETIREHFSHHIIKLTRTLARHLKNKFWALCLEKLALERQMLENSENGTVIKRFQLKTEVNYNDRLQIMGLKEFVLYGLGPTMKSSTATDTAFSSFYSLNAERVKLLVDIYGFDFDNYVLDEVEQTAYSQQ